DQRGRSAIPIWPFAACASAWRAATRRNRARPRSPRHADLWRTKHSRRNGVSQKQSRPGPDEQLARRSGSASASRFGNQTGERKKSLALACYQSITQSRFSLRRGRQRILANGDCLTARAPQLVRLDRIELAVLRE